MSEHVHILPHKFQRLNTVVQPVCNEDERKPFAHIVHESPAGRGPICEQDLGANATWMGS